jgi:serine/threonine-protein kinase
LLNFQAVPPQVEQPGAPPTEPDWTPLFAAANVDVPSLQPTEPLWTWLATSDKRQAWTGVWPGSKRPLRVEAAALRGKPVAFALIGPWNDHDRMPSNEPTEARLIFYGCVAVVVCLGAAILARQNLTAGRGDRRGAFRLAVFMFCLLIGLWLTRSHMTPSFGLLALLLIAVCTASFYAMLLWTIYLALEPFVRRYWPRTLVSWTRALSGRIHDPMVGRDALFGAALGVVWIFIGRISDLTEGHGIVAPTWTRPELLLGARSAVCELLVRSPRSLRDALIFFFLLFLLRVLLRNQWLAAAAFTLIWTIAHTIGSQNLMLDSIWNLLTYGLTAVLVLRYGLLALVVGMATEGFLGASPSLHVSAWYFGNLAFLTLSAVALIAWAFYTSMGGRRFLPPALLGLASVAWALPNMPQ